MTSSAEQGREQGGGRGGGDGTDGWTDGRDNGGGGSQGAELDVNSPASATPRLLSWKESAPSVHLAPQCVVLAAWVSMATAQQAWCGAPAEKSLALFPLPCPSSPLGEGLCGNLDVFSFRKICFLAQIIPHPKQQFCKREAVGWGRRKGTIPSLHSPWAGSDPRKGRSPGKHPGLACPAPQPAMRERPSASQVVQSPRAVAERAGQRDPES